VLRLLKSREDMFGAANFLMALIVFIFIFFKGYDKSLTKH